MISSPVARQQRYKLDLQLHAFAVAGIDAWTPGEGDLALGIDAVRDAAAAHDVPVVAANLRCNGTAPFSSGRVVQRGGVRVGFVGLIEPSLLGSGLGGCTAQPVLPALRSALAELGPVDATVVLSHMSAPADALLNRELPQGALIVNGHAGLTQSDPYNLGGGVVQLGSGLRGKLLGVATVTFEPGASGFLGKEAPGIERRVKRYQGRLDTAQTVLIDPDSDQAARDRAQRQIDFYQREIADLQGQLDAAAADVDSPRNQVSLRLVPLGTEVADDPATRVLVDQAKAGLATLGLAASDAASGAAPGAAPSDSQQPEDTVSYVGSAACRRCHKAEYSQWQATPHARAWTSLVRASRQADRVCWPCHVTGGLQGSASQAASPAVPLRPGVGCESCHGPGRDHAAKPDVVNIRRDPPQATCTQCHDGDRDEGRFDWDSYRDKVVHGVAVESTGG
ncbi:MAG: hypothetical protein GXP62_12160 [Oligoflexia bacterium]|nr:hypothetical protein [Oligoflexia bacterium]